MYSLVLRNAAHTRRWATITSIPRYSSTVSDNDPHVLEVEKRRNIQKIQHKTSTPHEYAPGWNEYLATTSEANVKADKSSDSIIDLQRKTVSHIMSRHSPDERMESREAVYSHETVLGPLGSATGVEDTHHRRENVKRKKVMREKVVEETRHVDE